MEILYPRRKHCQICWWTRDYGTEIDIPGHASALLSVYPEIENVVARCILLDEDPNLWFGTDES
jgi:hypothetical protein